MITTILITLVFAVNSLPIQEETTTSIPPNIQRDINVVSYIQNFKTVMSDYVTSQYKNLTIHETEQVQETLEEFLIRFARDLREAVDSTKVEVIEKIEDGVPEETFDEIKSRIKEEFPEINEDTAEQIVYRLRKNLYETRQRLVHIIRDSEKAQIDNIDLV